MIHLKCLGFECIYYIHHMYLKICIIDEIVRETEELNFYFSADLFCVGRGISEKQNMKTWWCDCLFFYHQ